MAQIVIGIDPDIERNGVAILDTSTRSISLQSLTLAETIDTITEENTHAESLIAVVEAGWANKSNYHLTAYDSKRSAAKKGVDQGRNHQRGIDIVELLQHNGVNIAQIKPLPKIWAKGKASDKELRKFMTIAKKRTNQEERDAALIAWVYAGFKIKK